MHLIDRPASVPRAAQMLLRVALLAARALCAAVGLGIVYASCAIYAGLPEMWDPATFGLILAYIGVRGMPELERR